MILLELGLVSKMNGNTLNLKCYHIESYIELLILSCKQAYIGSFSFATSIFNIEPNLKYRNKQK